MKGMQDQFPFKNEFELVFLCGSWVPRRRMKTLRIPGLAFRADNQTGRCRAHVNLSDNNQERRLGLHFDVRNHGFGWYQISGAYELVT